MFPSHKCIILITDAEKQQNTKEFTMKKITMITAIFLLVLSATFADKVISADQLSAGAKDFISKTLKPFSS